MQLRVLLDEHNSSLGSINWYTILGVSLDSAISLLEIYPKEVIKDEDLCVMCAHLSFLLEK